jgi:hypothetical protein
MNHQKIYDAIIQKAKSENRKKLRNNQENYVYYENHHILPKCLGGSNDKENKVLLTAREHFICHKLLIYIYPKNTGIILAVFRMIHSKNLKIIISSRDYKFVKELLSNQLTGRKLTKEHRKNIGKGVKGKTKGMPKTAEAKFNMRKSRLKFLKENVNPLLGTKRPEQSENQRGENNPFYRKKHTNKAKKIIREKMKKLMKGKIIGFNDVKCEHCGIITTSGNYARWHGEKCKFKNSNNELDIIDI